MSAEFTHPWSLARFSSAPEDRVNSPVRSAVEIRQLIDEAQRLIDAIEVRTIAGLRDRAIIGIMGYAQASVDSVISMQVRDYYSLGDRRWVWLRENGIERYEIVDRRLEPHIDAYLAAAAIAADEPRSPLFRTTLQHSRHLSTRQVARPQILSMIWNISQRTRKQRRSEVSGSKSKTLARLLDG